MISAISVTVLGAAVNSRILRVNQSFLLEDVLALVSLAPKFQTLANALGWSRGKEGSLLSHGKMTSIVWLLSKQDQMPEIEIQCDRKMTFNFT